MTFIASLFLFWNRGLSLLDLILCAAFYVLTMLGITLGYHRLFTHRSFKCKSPIRAGLCIAGSMAAQGPVFFWTACHRRHHRHSDDVGDPHSPHHSGTGIKGLLIGWWHSHVGWMFDHEPENYVRLVPDLIREPLLRGLNRYYLYFVFGGLLLPGAIAFALTGRWMAVATAILWGGFVRVFLVHHSTWSINSICHMFGESPYTTDDKSRNNLVCALLTLGEGWHNNHHAFPTSARHGLEWWQCDVVYMVIRILAKARLAWDIRLPSAEQMASRLRVSPVTQASTLNHRTQETLAEAAVLGMRPRN